MDKLSATEIKTAVRERYAGHATTGSSCCGPDSRASSCCRDNAPSPSEALGYDATDLAAIPEGADLGLGCGNPLAILALREGETVLDLGSGGIDCFLAARRVGPTGHVIGVDMTPEMIDHARRNAATSGVDNVVLGEMPMQIRDSVEAYVACLSGAVLRDEYLRLIREAGFSDVTVDSEQGFDLEDVVAADVVAEFQRHTGATETELRAAALFRSVRVSARK